MERIMQIVIKNCYDCPFIGVMGCGETNKMWTSKQLEEIDTDTPEWCPLPARED